MVLTDERWAALEPLLEACRPKGKTPPRDLRRTVEAIVWRHANGAKWRAVPAELGPWWRAAQLFIRWAKLGVWPRLLEAAQARGVELGMAFLDGTSIRAHPKAAGAPKKGGADSRAKRNGLSEADLHVLAKLFEQRLDRGEEAEALAGRQVVAQHDLLQLSVAQGVQVEVAGQVAT